MDNFIITLIWGLLQIWFHNNQHQGRWYQRKVEIRLYFEEGDFYSDYLYWWNTACLRVWRVFVVPWESGQWHSWLAIKGFELCIHDDKDCLLVMLVQLLCCGHCCRVVQITETPEHEFKFKPTLVHEAMISSTLSSVWKQRSSSRLGTISMISMISSLLSSVGKHRSSLRLGTISPQVTWQNLWRDLLV